jgi:hypothetical protein
MEALTLTKSTEAPEIIDEAKFGISIALDSRRVVCPRLARRSSSDQFASSAHPFAPFLRPAYTWSTYLSLW